MLAINERAQETYIGRIGAPGFVAAFAVLLGVFGMDTWQSLESRKAFEWVSHTRAVQAQLSKVLSTLQDAETGQRGYLLTGVEAYLEPFEIASQQVRIVLEDLRTLTADNPRQQERLDRIEPLVGEKFDELLETISLLQTDGLDAALALVQTDRGKTVMDKIRSHIANMEAEENALLAERKEYAAWVTTSTLILEGVGFAVIILIAMLVVRKISLGIDQRKQVMESLRDSEEKSRAILETVLDGIITIDERGKIASFNQAAQRLFGYRSHEVLGRNVNVLMPEPYRSGHDGYVRAFIESGDAKIIGTVRVLEARRKDGMTFPMELAVSEMQLGGGPMFTGIVRDITERKQAERIEQKLKEQATQAQKIEALGTLAGGIAHDFNNSLFPIIGLTELTKAKLPEDSKEYLALSKVLVAAHHAKDLVQQILAFSRQEPLNRRPVELRKVLSDALSFLRAGLPSTIKIEDHIHETPSFVLADPTQIQQILINLGANARDAMQNEGGTLTVDLSEVQVGDDLEKPFGDLEPGAYVRLEVTDTGCGMSEETVARIFEPFFTTKEVGEGTGLGLSLVHRIVKNHDGALTVRSEPGHGTTFAVFFPALKTPIGELAPDEPRLEMEDIPSLSEF